MIIIPARLESTRFPKKVLADIGGLPMVIRTAKQVLHLDNVCIATDSKDVIDVCCKYKIQALLTSTSHKSGTDRINECATLLQLPQDEFIINLQADEPFIEPEVIKALIAKLKELKKRKSAFIMVSCFNSINKETANDPNLVKVVLDNHQHAIYFSRNLIPYDRSGTASYFGHLGIYGFNKESLQHFCNLDDAPLENIEKLEQLRAIYHAKRISMIKVTSTSFGIDTLEDLEYAKKIFLS